MSSWTKLNIQCFFFFCEIVLNQYSGMTLTWSSFNNNATDSVDDVQCVVWFSFADAPTLADLFPSPASTVGATPLFFSKLSVPQMDCASWMYAGGKKFHLVHQVSLEASIFQKCGRISQLISFSWCDLRGANTSNTACPILSGLSHSFSSAHPPDYLFLNQDKRHPYKCVVAPYLLNSYLLLNCFPLWVQLVRVGAVSDVETCRVTSGSPSFVPTSV